MLTIFIEYKIDEKFIQNYFKQREEVLRRLTQESMIQHQFLEAIDQHHLFVEMVQIPTKDLYQQWKQMLETEDHRLPWYPILPFILGGKKKFNMWLFRNNQERTYHV